MSLVYSRLNQHAFESLQGLVIWGAMGFNPGRSLIRRLQAGVYADTPLRCFSCDQSSNKTRSTGRNLGHRAQF